MRLEIKIQKEEEEFDNKDLLSHSIPKFSIIIGCQKVED